MAKIVKSCGSVSLFAAHDRVQLLLLPKMQKMIYHKGAFRASFMIDTYLFFMLTMVGMGVYIRSALSILVGKFVGDGLITIGNTLLAPSDRNVAMIEQAL